MGIPSPRPESVTDHRRRRAGWLAVLALGLAAWVAAPTARSSATGTIKVQTEYDGGGRTVPGIGGGPGEGMPAVFEVQDGGAVRNVTITATTDGIHCLGSCTVENVHWLSVGDDAVTAYGGPGTTVTVRNSRVDYAVDKAVQHNGGGTVVLEGMSTGTVGHLYASCGDCGTTAPRSVAAAGVLVDRALYDAFAVQNGDSSPRLSDVTIRQGRECTYYDGNASTGQDCAMPPWGP